MNHQLFNKKMSFRPIAPYNILLRYKGEMEQATVAVGDRSEAPNITKNALSFNWSGWSDSNRRPPRPKRGALAN